MNNKLKIKDLVTIGVFIVIYFCTMFGVGMMGVVPILFLIYPTILGIIGGVIVMLLMAKIQKPWALFVFGMISPVIMFALGHTYIIVVLSLIVVGIAELIRKLGNYHSFKFDSLSYAVFNMWICGSLMQMLLVKEKYIQLTVSQMGQNYADKLEKLITYKNMSIVYIGAFVGGIIGAYVAKVLLKKHFVKAGII